MASHSMQRDRALRLWLGAVLIAAWAVLFGGSPIGAQSRPYLVAVLTPGGALSPVLEGLQEEFKRLETLKEIAPGIKKVLAIVVANEEVSKMSIQFLEESAHKLGIEILRREVTTRAEIEQVLQGTPVGSVDAICHVPSALVGSHIELLIQKAKADKIPLVVTDSSMVQQGALVFYGGDFRLLGAQAARFVAKVLKGAKPSEIPIQTPEKLVLVINLTTAKAIGLEIPRAIFERADLLME
jgi:putative tryptophan/tyrosine transport system substrate-binding protein